MNTAGQLQVIKDKIRTTKDKTVTVNALTAEGQRHLEALGFKIKRTKGKRVRVTAPTNTARGAVGALQRAIDALRGRTVTITSVFKSVYYTAGDPDTLAKAHGRKDGGLIGYAGGGQVRGYPSGGRVYGPGTATSDSIPAMLSRGEYVIKAAAVNKYGSKLFDRLNSMSLASRATAYQPAGAQAIPARAMAAPAPPQAPPPVAGDSHYTTNVYARTADFTVSDLQRVQRQQEAHQRVRRPK